jgi:alkylhydroperoxidase family enzyme
VGRKAGISEEQLRDIADYGKSEAFSPLERLVIEYAERMTRTPLDVPDELFFALREHLNEAQLVELTATVAWENFFSRFNRAFKIEAQGFTEGAYCVLAERCAT